MRRVFTPTGELDEEQLLPEHPDEKVHRLAKDLMERRPNLTFTQAKTEVLRQDPALAKAYAEQFS